MIGGKIKSFRHQADLGQQAQNEVPDLGEESQLFDEQRGDDDEDQ